MEEIVEYIIQKQQEGYKVVIATDYKARLEEVLRDLNFYILMI
jgi:FMN phosphatase YigB (HAD superfamily)